MLRSPIWKHRKVEAGYLHVARALALAERGLAIALDPAHRFQLSMQVGRLQRDLGQGEPALASFHARARHCRR